RLAVESADAGRPIDLVAGESVEVAAERLYVDGHVGHSLSAVDEDGDALAVRGLDHASNGKHRAEGVGAVCERDEARARTEEPLVGFDIHLSRVVDRRHAKRRPFLLAEHLPGDDGRARLAGGDGRGAW